MLYIISIIILVALDQVTKDLIVKKFYLGETLPVMDEFFHLTYVQNKGIAFGLMQGHREIIAIFTIVAIVVMIYYFMRYLKGSPLWEKIAYVFIFSGAIGNMIDRVYRGFVVDMIDFRGIWIYIFNLADVWINIGLICIIIDYFIRRNKE